MIDFFTGLITLVGTIGLYVSSKKLNKKYPSPFTLPLLIATVVIVAFLALLDIPYGTYMIGGQWVDQLLGPVVVALALPLYKQWKILKANLLPLLGGVSIGSIIGITSGLLLVKWGGFEEVILNSIASKSVTTPVSMEIAHSLGGAPSLAATFVMFAGIGGAVFGPIFLRYVRIKDSIAKGISMGTASHAIGTARIMEDSELEGAVSTVAMSISAIIVAVITPTIIYLFF